MNLYNLLAQAPLDILDKASAASDRWLFLGFVGLIIIAFIYIYKEKRSSEVANHAFMLTIYTESMKLTAQVLVVLQENNTVLRDAKEVIAKLNDRLDRLEQDDKLHH